MKKFLKVILGAGAIIGGIAGVLYFIDKKKEDDDFEEFNDEEFDDIFEDETEERDYVTLDLEKEEDASAEPEPES